MVLEILKYMRQNLGRQSPLASPIHFWGSSPVIYAHIWRRGGEEKRRVLVFTHCHAHATGSCDELIGPVGKSAKRIQPTPMAYPEHRGDRGRPFPYANDSKIVRMFSTTFENLFYINTLLHEVSTGGYYLHHVSAKQHLRFCYVQVFANMCKFY